MRQYAYCNQFLAIYIQDQLNGI